jgi:hypothetical protein
MGNETKFTGGCHCGAIRYEGDQPPFWTGYCHCRTCQRVYGNAFGLWATFYSNDFRIIKGKPKTYKSSVWAEVGFCENCGTPLTFRYLEPLIKNKRKLDLRGVTVGSLDNPENIKPTVHGYVDAKLSWLSIEDGLPQTVSADDTEAREIDI